MEGCNEKINIDESPEVKFCTLTPLWVLLPRPQTCDLRVIQIIIMLITVIIIITIAHIYEALGMCQTLF